MNAHQDMITNLGKMKAELEQEYRTVKIKLVVYILCGLFKNICFQKDMAKYQFYTAQCQLRFCFTPSLKVL